MRLSTTSILIFLSIVVFTITAYYSVGFFQADEHFQILEFAGLKAGWNTPNDVVWEYHTQIRSTIQPTIAYGFISIFKFFGITDPYTLSFLLREITGLTLIFALVFFYKNTNRFIKSRKHPQYDKLLKHLFLGFLLLIWYVPYLGVRFSSETWSAIFLLIAMSCFCSENKTKKKLLLTGLFFGISFLFRFQIAFIIAGFGIHQLIFGTQKLKTSLHLITGFLLALVIGFFIDSWFYSNWVFTPWEYFFTFFNPQMVDGKVLNFGTESWDYYFNRLFLLPTKLIGSLIFLSLTAALIFRGKSVFIWMILSFILVHMLIGHKEERFLFPIVFFFPLFFVQFFQLLIDYIPSKIALTLVGLTSLGILITSTVGLPILATSSAGLGKNGITRFIHQNYQNKPVNLIAMPYSNPYAPWFLNERFYLDQNVHFTPINNFEELDSTVIKKDTINLFVTTYFFLENYPQKENIQKLGFHLIQQSVPDYQLKMDKFVREIDDQYVTYLYELKK
jgi:GPI mannosyltransferase 3